MEVRNKVRLPNGELCIEVENINRGNSETTSFYTYYKLANNPNDPLCLGERLDVSAFKQESWDGQVLGLQYGSYSVHLK